MRIAVLGATGVAGRAFVPKARARGHALATDRADVFDVAGLEGLMRGCGAVVNLVTSIPRPGGRGDWAQNDRIRREGTATVIEACRRAGVGRLVQQSVAMLHCVADDRPQVEDDPIEGYGLLASAVDMELLVRDAPLDGRLVRGALFVGPGTGREEQWAAEMASPGSPVAGEGQGWLSVVHVDDFAEALLTVLERGRPREAYIASGEPFHGLGRLRSFRVSSDKLRALGWRPRDFLLPTTH